MIDLNNLEEIKKLDPQNTYNTTELLLEQCKEAWSQVDELQIPENVGKISNLIFCGMGASIYGALVFKALAGENLSFPIEIISDYHLPRYADINSLVVLTSYSGTTEEVLSCAEEALAKKTKMLVLTKGGKLAEFAKNNNVPAYIFDEKLNPAGVPRLGNGYTILGLLGLLNKFGVSKLSTKKIQEAISFAEKKKTILKEKAKNDAKIFFNKIPIIFAAEHLSGNAQIMRNQFNETSKTFSGFYLIPDLNHHLMEGLKFPEDSNLYFLVFDSKNYSSKIQKRIKLTIDVVNKNKQKIYEYQTTGANIYQDFLEVMLYGSFLTLYLGLLNNQNPAINPWVDYFKDMLKQ